MRLMRLLLASTGILFAASVATAQTRSQNRFDNWDLTIEFTSRGALGGNAGHVSQGQANGFIAGLETLTSAQYTIQDQNLATREAWNSGTCVLDGAGNPDYPGKNNYATNMMLPPGNGVGAFVITHTMLAQNPHKVPQTCEQWHHVWNLTQTANWATDGLGVHMSQAAPWQMTQLCGRSQNGATGHREIPRTDGTPAAQIIEEYGWSNQAQSAVPAVQNRSWRLTMWFDEPCLYVGVFNDAYNRTPCPNPNFGYASIDPDFNDMVSGQPARYDDLQFRFGAGPAFGQGVAVMLWSNTVFPGGGVPTPFGRLFVNLGDPLLGAFGPIVMRPFDAAGNTSHDVKLGPANSLFRQVMAEFASLSAQGVAVSRSGQVQLSSLCTMRNILQPTGWMSGTAQMGQPLSLTRSISQQTIVVRNDGRGQLSVQPKRNASNIGAATVVCERTAVRILIPAAANAVEISSTKTNATKLAYGWNQ